MTLYFLLAASGEATLACSFRFLSTSHGSIVHRICEGGQLVLSLPWLGLQPCYWVKKKRWGFLALKRDVVDEMEWEWCSRFRIGCLHRSGGCKWGKWGKWEKPPWIIKAKNYCTLNMGTRKDVFFTNHGSLCFNSKHFRSLSFDVLRLSSQACVGWCKGRNSPAGRIVEVVSLMWQCLGRSNSQYLMGRFLTCNDS